MIAAKTASYVEQFEGMYVMMRGIAAAAGIGCAYLVGWLAAPFIERGVLWVSVAFFVLGSAVAWGQGKKPEARQALMFFTLAAVASCGALAASPANVALCVAAATVCAVVAVLAFGAYHEFTWRWAGSVYRSFYLLTRTPPKPDA